MTAPSSAFASDNAAPVHPQVIDAIVTCYTEAMVAHHEANKYPPVRGMTPTPDPMTPSAANLFVDMEDDLPWEEPKGRKP